MRHIVSILAFAFALAPAAARAQVPGVTVTDGVTTLQTASTIDFTSGCTLTSSGRTANMACTGTGVPTTRAINTTSPLGGGGTLAMDLTLTCTTCAVTTGTTFTGSVGFNAGITAAGAVANDFSGGTGDFKLSTGSFSWAGASGKTISLVGTGVGSTVNIDGAGAETYGPSATSVTIGNTSTGFLRENSNDARVAWAGVATVSADTVKIRFATTQSAIDVLVASAIMRSVTDNAVALGDSTHRWGQSYFKRIALEGTAVVAGDFALSGNWGQMPSVTVTSGDDNHAIIVVTAGSAATGANPTIQLTFHDGTWTQTPYCMAKIEATSDSATALTTAITDSTAVNAYTITYNGTPTANKTYTFQYLCIGG